MTGREENKNAMAKGSFHRCISGQKPPALLQSACKRDTNWNDSVNGSLLRIFKSLAETSIVLYFIQMGICAIASSGLAQTSVALFVYS